MQPSARPARRAPIERRRPDRMVTPTRVVLALAIVLSLGLLVFGVIERGRAQVPILVSGATILGLSLVGAGLIGARAAYAAGRRGAAGRALLYAVLGGGCMLGAAGALGGAVVLGMLYGSASGR
ncbi:MAG TPA: hypothetical protein VFK38_02250 [Candidatus Limnocylindrales bacterium]|nr:hypothetical protein [Candidatus Limnocylindrales bacterium]